MHVRTWLGFPLIALTLAAPAAIAQCDISQTKCALNNGNCNIKFKNRTADGGIFGRNQPRTGLDGANHFDQSA